MIQLARPVPSESLPGHQPLAGVPGPAAADALREPAPESARGSSAAPPPPSSEPGEDVSAETRSLGAPPTSAPASAPAPALALDTRSGLTDGPTDPAFALAAGCTGVTPRQRKNVVLGDEIARLSAHIQAATGRLLDLIRAFEASEGWYEEGFKSCAQWLSWRTGIAPGAAREKVRVARALGGLPELSAALGSGQLSYSVARALTRVATAENEAELVEVARHATAADMERLVRAWQVADRSEADEQERHALRYLWVVPEADGSWTVRGRLDPEVGAVLSRALEAAEETLHATYTTELGAVDSPESQPSAQDRAQDRARDKAQDQAQARRQSWAEHPAEARRADAIGFVAEAALGCHLGAPAGSDAAGGAEGAAVVSRAERFQVVLHVSAETLASEDELGV